jgi:hypothetical protein
MFDWLFEGWPAVYVLLLGGAAILGFLWTRDRKRHWLVAAGVLVGLAGVYLLLDWLVETRREQIERKTGEMAAAVKNRDVDRIFQHISSRFRIGQATDKARFRQKVEDGLKRGLIDSVEVWELRWPQALPPAGSGQPARVVFMAKPKGSPVLTGAEQFRVEADFIQDPDGQWRMQGFQVFDPFRDPQTPIDILRWLE